MILFLMLLATAAVPGGVVAIPVAEDATAARFEGRAALLYRGHAIVGVPLDTETGEYHLVVDRSDAPSYRSPFVVVPKEYPVQRLTIANPRHVNPNDQDLERFAREAALMRDAYAVIGPDVGDPHPFVRPVDGVVSSPFGRRRVLNGEPRSPHSGLDIAADRGTPIRAPAPGRVLVTGDFFFNGNTVLMDHGGGLVTMYCHLDEIRVAQGETLPRGGLLGLVGATGRATGPHLHWTVSLHGAKVDPGMLAETLESLQTAR